MILVPALQAVHHARKRRRLSPPRGPAPALPQGRFDAHAHRRPRDEGGSPKRTRDATFPASNVWWWTHGLPPSSRPKRSRRRGGATTRGVWSTGAPRALLGPVMVTTCRSPPGRPPRSWPSPGLAAGTADRVRGWVPGRGARGVRVRALPSPPVRGRDLATVPRHRSSPPTLGPRPRVCRGLGVRPGRRLGPGAAAVRPSEEAASRVSFLSVMICHRVVVCPQASRPRAYIAPEADAEPH